MSAISDGASGSQIGGFLGSAFVRDLPRDEIVSRGLGLKWWGEFTGELVCVSGVVGVVKIPAGFLTDGASVPRMVWSLLSDTDPDILYPSYLHDLLYSLRGALGPVGRRVLFSREQCDQVLREMMLSIGAPRWKAEAVYRAVRLGGGSAWARSEPDWQIKKGSLL